MRIVYLLVLSAMSVLGGRLCGQVSSAPCYEPALGTLVGFDDDFVFPAITLANPYPAFGNVYLQAEISSNGFVWLGANGNTDSGCCSGTGAGLAAGAARICAFWTDLVTDGQGGSGVYHNSLPGREVITWWNAFESFDPTIRFTVQLQLVATGEFTVWFHPLTTVQQFHSAVCGASPGGTTAPPSVDLSASIPHNSGTQATLYEEWANGTFDLTQRAFEFLPNGAGGWLMQDRPACPFVAGAWTTYGQGCPPLTGISGASFYEVGTGANLDLDNLEFELLPVGTVGYTVQATTNSFFNGYSNVVPLQDDQVIDQNLPFAFSHPGGVCTIAGFCSNGFVWLDNFNNSPPASPFVPAFLFDSPRIAALWTDLDPTSFGTTYFDATANVAYFTWVQVADLFNPTLRSTFQIQLHDDGRIKLCYQGVDIGAGRPWLAGFGLGGQTYDPGSLDLSNDVPFTSGTGLLPVTLDWVGQPPVVGQPFPLLAGNLRPSAVLGMLVLGLTQFNPGIPLDNIGMNGCFLHTTLDLGLVFPITGPTTPVNVLTIAPEVSWVGQQWYTQLAIFDAGLTPLGILASNGGTMSLGMY